MSGFCDFDNEDARCPRCGFVAGGRDWLKPCSGRQHREPSLPHTAGPGTELHQLLAEIGFAACSPCVLRAAEMDRRGVERCRATRDELIGWLQEAEAKAGFVAKWSKAPRATTIVPFWHWTDPIPWIVDESIRRAERTEVCATSFRAK